MNTPLLSPLLSGNYYIWIQALALRFFTICFLLMFFPVNQPTPKNIMKILCLLHNLFYYNAVLLLSMMMHLYPTFWVCSIMCHVYYRQSGHLPKWSTLTGNMNFLITASWFANQFLQLLPVEWAILHHTFVIVYTAASHSGSWVQVMSYFCHPMKFTIPRLPHSANGITKLLFQCWHIYHLLWHCRPYTDDILKIKEYHSLLRTANHFPLINTMEY